MGYSPDPINTMENLTVKNGSKSISIYALVIISLITLILALPFIEVDVTSQSRGVVRSQKETVSLNTIVEGEIILFNMKNNQAVNVGDTLIMIAKEDIESQKELNDTLIKGSKLLMNDLNRLLTGSTSAFETSRGREMYNTFFSKKIELANKLNLAESNFIRQKQLFDKMVISQSVYEKYVYEYNAARQVIKSFTKQNRSSWELQKQELQERQKSLENNITNLNIQSSNYTITAPLTGTLENVKGLQVGSFVSASQTIAQISPDSDLIVENIVYPSEIGLLKKGQNVKFQFDAFNYNQWGLLEGRIIEIDKNITLDNSTAFFKIRCSLESKELRLKNGYEAKISKGMTLTTRYFINRRSIWELLFDKIDDWLNPKVINPTEKNPL